MFLSLYKIANVWPILKRGDPSDPGNYRPISLLPVASKLLERCVYEQLMTYLCHDSDALPKEQFAYCRQHSCEDLLTIVTDDWQKCLDRGQYVAAAFLDLSKAFDTVNRDALLHELFAIRIRGTALQWLGSFLRDRQQRVFTNFQCGEPCTPTRGVPQWSTLGPLQFNLSVHSLPSCSITGKVRQFADDVSLYRAGADLQKITNDISADISIIKTHLRERGVTLNDTKTQFIIFRRRKKQSTLIQSSTSNSILQLSTQRPPSSTSASTLMSTCYSQTISLQ
eukprot:scpid54423/ scgid29217/ RNA-directed DNA polymerase from mobile element jockey; Reverse transcriptase